MLNHTIEITADNQPTVLERLLQVTRYRGFVVSRLNVIPNTDNNMLDIKLTVQDPKQSSIQVGAGIMGLFDQLNKVFDIKHVNLVRPSSIQCQA